MKNVEVVHLGKVVEILEGLPTVIHYRGGTVEAAVLVELVMDAGFQLECGIRSLGHKLYYENGIMSLGIGCKLHHEFRASPSRAAS